jgi:hypothetical protein
MSDRRDSRERKTALLSIAVSGVMLLAGCGTLPGTSGGSSGTVVVMTWAPEDTDATNVPGMPAMATAYAKYINAKGGIGGHPLKVLTCNEHNTTSGAEACAQRAADEGVAAVVGSYSQHGTSFLSVLEAEGIPYLGGFGITDDEFDSPLSYPVNGGLSSLLAGNGRQLAPTCSSVTIVRPDTAAGDELPAFLDAGLRAGGRPDATDLRAAEDSTDYTSAAEKSAGDGSHDRCVTAVLGEKTATFFDSFRRTTVTDTVSGKQVAPKTRIASVLGSVQQSTVDSSGGSASPLEGAYVTGWYPPASDAHWGPMKQAITKYAFDDNRIDADDPAAQTTWIAYTVLTEVIESMGGRTVSSASLKKALDNAHGISTGGLTPDLGWRDQDLTSVPDHPRMANGKVTYQVVTNGRLVAARKGFIDMAPTMSAATLIR